MLEEKGECKVRWILVMFSHWDGIRLKVKVNLSNHSGDLVDVQMSGPHSGDFDAVVPQTHSEKLIQHKKKSNTLFFISALFISFLRLLPLFFIAVFLYLCICEKFFQPLSDVFLEPLLPPFPDKLLLLLHRIEWVWQSLWTGVGAC